MVTGEVSDGPNAGVPVGEPSSARSPGWRVVIWPLAVFVVLAAAIFLVYAPGLQAPFIYDDADAVVNNASLDPLWPLLRSPGPLSPPAQTPTSGRPLVNLSLAVNRAIGQVDPLGYHVFNDLLHVFSAVLVWALTARLLSLDYFHGRFTRTAPWLALGVALVWALHPLETQAVEYVTQRTELLVSLFYLLTVYASLRYFTAAARASRYLWLAVAAMACLAGVASKEVMATAPLTVALLEWTFFHDDPNRGGRRSWPLYLALAPSWLLLAALNLGGPRSESAGFHAGVAAHSWWLTQCQVLGMYVKLAFWPTPLVLHYELPVVESLGEVWPWVLGVAAAMLATLVLLWKRSAIGFLGAWFFLLLAPTLVVPVVTEVAAERRMYLALVALVALALVGGFALLDWLRKGASVPWPAAVTAAATLLAVTACGADSRREVSLYRDPVDLWQAAIAAEPNNLQAHMHVAELLIQQGRLEEAQIHVDRIRELAPEGAFEYPSIAGKLALIRQRYPEAIEFFRRVVDLRPASASAYNNLGLALSAGGQLESAVSTLEKALELSPGYAEGHVNLATALANQGQFDRALDEYALALRANPGLAGAHTSMGVILANTGRAKEAIQHLQASARLQPAPEIYHLLAVAYLRDRQVREAVEALDHAIGLARLSGKTELAAQYEGMRSQLRGLPTQQP